MQNLSVFSSDFTKDFVVVVEAFVDSDGGLLLR
jgi:hypothetical protein